MGKLIDRRPPAGVNGADPDPTAEALALEVAEAEAEAEAAEARIAAAQARARAARLRRQASAVETQTPDVAAPPDEDAAPEDGAPADSDGTLASEPPLSRSWGRRIGQRPRRGAVIAALVTVAALTVSGYLLWHHQDVAGEQQRAAEFVAAARQGVVTLTTLDSSQAEADVQRVLDSSTGAFRDDFENRASDFTDVIQKSSVATEGQVNAAAVESMSDDSAVVLVAATSTVTNSAGAEQEPRAWRLSVTVTRDRGQLKMSKVEFVP
ncbi:hypothetical protein [Rhodococcus gannanensis]|uniref:Mce-associated membrane protein n=1 Tax=Rhodococcus gannanensis TaxID=1960308 RepID=A0ABW4P259_9NOCA